jgi:hypothetical protein
VEATITLGSLAKGTEDHVKALVDLGVVPVLINGKFHLKFSLCTHIHTHTLTTMPQRRVGLAV